MTLPIHSIDDLEKVLSAGSPDQRSTGRPFVTVSYAQSIDGSIATKDRRPLRLSGEASMVLTHRLRAACDGILVGIETVIADDPQLTVRKVRGSNPQPIVLDTRLRTPLSSKLLGRRDCRSWVACSPKMTSPAREGDVLRKGAALIHCDLDARGRIDLHHLMGMIKKKGISSLMVEGGARVITSFILARLVDLFVITISPRLVAGLQVLEPPRARSNGALALADIYYEQMGTDMVIWALPDWSGP
ncbi:MAG: RibD family protein [Desulfobacterales bacterium]|jgi:3,4-dihydroxy 2-butanone 4-phosphate synthase/GTP cyclohydrolase II